ncbi:hypothetical protein AXK56_07635 [Tsukamurella pulmonis]|uniref:Uncharacterized protein n=1 Tax=Tsukamurella pulmonis TaxID=47312 RepID=A0A1H1C9A0_9ACTN|nr:hypothetical protein [Tsukamurella pulmonis]KXO90414.1 hypothetical protein AXK56_07635 [Tsukamurella pulmonis]SDQ60734.1 hypothetical protein SAMN04489765_1088 [Tsukamurella pulmonis]SUP24030.1 Uncharacterised protein [Tsukamurella pulmonis]
MTDPRPTDLDRARENVGRALSGITGFARATSAQLASQAGELKDTAFSTVEKLNSKDEDPYDLAVAEYNATYTAMSDSGVALLLERQRTADVIDLVEFLVNSIARTPKSFAADFAEIEVHKAQFLGAEDFARKDLEAARASAISAGAGFSAAAAVAGMAPTAAMWAATTFGTASTGTAISTLSGAVATKAALAWLGGGAVAAGGGGTAAGSALLALAGPIGWSVAGATLLASVALFTKKKFDNRDSKHDALTSVKENTAQISRIHAEIVDLLDRTSRLRGRLVVSYGQRLEFYRSDFEALDASDQVRLAALVNNTKASAALLAQHVVLDASEDDIDA